MSEQYSRELAGAVKEFLDGDDWHYDFIEDKGLFQFITVLHGRVKTVRCYIDVREDFLLTYFVLPVGPDVNDADMMQEMAAFLCMANYGMKYGNFEIDWKDGEIRYKSFLDCEDMTPSMTQIRNSLYIGLSTLKKYLPGMIDIIFNQTDAKTAIAGCDDDYPVGQVS